MERNTHTHTSCGWLVGVRIAAGLTLMSAPVLAQAIPVPAPVQPLANRHVHPSIATITPQTVLNGTGPLFQYPDGIWNHGEGFSATNLDHDQGGWFGEDDGSNVTVSHIHQTIGWSSWTWTSDTHPASPQQIRRFVGFLYAPLVSNLPTVHPLYGPLPAGSGPFNNGTYVDQGAFEAFAPMGQPAPGQKIVVIINCWETTGAPRGQDGGNFGSVYDGYFSPDGLRRNEHAPTTTQLHHVSDFLANTSAYTVLRPPFGHVMVATAAWHNANYYPIAAYVVQSMPARQTTLNEQRTMQLRQAMLLMLQQSDSRNPLATPLTPAQVEQRVVVVFVGGSNGGTQATFAGLRYPDRIHGAFNEVINPSHQRLFGEQDVNNAFGRLEGQTTGGGATSEWDTMNWGRYAWNQDYWIHDLGVPRGMVRNQIYRPTYFRVGDEDETSSGTDWAWLANGAAWTEAGTTSSLPANWPAASRWAWSITKNACHGTMNATINPYTGGQTFYFDDAAHELILEAIANRTAQVTQTTVPTPLTIPSENRTSQLRGLDDPHEWALGRPGVAMGATSTLLQNDDTWFANVQPGAAGTWLGHKEAMLIRDRKLYVVGAEGVVTAFDVDLTPGNAQRLRKVAQTHDASGRPMSLGLDACALASTPVSNWEIVVGTRRHLYKLDRTTLAVTAGPVELPWEVGQPHHMLVVDLLPNSFSGGGGTGNGAEIVFAALQGGLVFYSQGLQPLYEWPEPGIVDFVQTGVAKATILSQRGVVASVDFSAVTSPAMKPTLLAASRPLPRKYQQYVPSGQQVDELDSASQGRPLDLELMSVNDGSGGLQSRVIGLWQGDADSMAGVAVRSYVPSTLVAGRAFLENVDGSAPYGRGSADMAPCIVSDPDVKGKAGNHLLVLNGDRIHLFNTIGSSVGAKDLLFTSQAGNPYYPFGRQTHSIAVGDLVDNALTGSQGIYQEEVVIATQSGALMWMHINDIAAPGSLLGPAYHITNLGTPTSNFQPRTNQSMSATWGMAQRAGDTTHLHLLDQRGGYWTVDATGSARLVDRELMAVGTRGWDDLGNRNASGVLVPITTQSWIPLELGMASVPGSFASIITPRPWRPKDVINIAYEKTGHFIQDNWSRATAPIYSFQGFVVHQWGGCVLDSAQGGGKQVWAWSESELDGYPGWANLLQGLQGGLSSGGTSWDIANLWASTGYSALSGPANHLPYHDLRSFVPFVPMMSDQAVCAFHLPGGGEALVLGCPGGRVRVLQPGAWGAPGQGHALGSLVESGDFGYGGGALAARQEANGSLRIWLGTVYGPTPRPMAYASAATAGQGLLDGEVATGSVHRLTWSPGATQVTEVVSRSLAPSATSRGGYGVVGLCVADLIPEPVGQQVDELIVTALAGDVFVLNADTLTELWHANVPGGVGFHNAIRVADLDGDAFQELYVAGSYGIWRFTQSGTGTHP